MSDGVTIELSPEWDAFESALDAKKFKARLAEHLAIANQRIGRQFVATAQRQIRAGKYAPNSPITAILKGSSKPLVDTGALFQGLSFATPDPFTVRLGIMRARAGDEVVNVGLILHEGATINVSSKPQVRRKVWSMVRRALAQQGAAAAAALNPGGNAKDVWVIPPRPFIVQPLSSAGFQKFLRAQFEGAVRATLLGAGED